MIKTMHTDTPAGSTATASSDRLFSLLRELDAAIPKGEGTVSLRLFSDESGRFYLEMWGAPVASGPMGGEMVMDSDLVIGTNPQWLPDLEALVARLNSILTSTRDQWHPPTP